MATFGIAISGRLIPNDRLLATVVLVGEATPGWTQKRAGARDLARRLFLSGGHYYAGMIFRATGLADDGAAAVACRETRAYAWHS